jgi:hypothetical protein
MAIDRIRTPTAMLMATLTTGLTLIAACGGGPSSSQAPAQSPARPPQSSGTQPTAITADADQRLASEVSRFLDTWAVKRQPKAAVQGKASAVFGDSRFVPATTLTPAQYKAQASAAAAVAPISEQAFQSALESQLAAALGEEPSAQGAAPEAAKPLDALLVPFSPEIAREKAPDLWEHIGERNPRTLTIAGVPALAYQVRSWNDIKWTASGTVGFRFAMENIIKQKGVNLQAVVTAVKLSATTGEEAPIVTLWSDEGRGGAEWRLVGMELPQTR